MPRPTLLIPASTMTCVLVLAACSGTAAKHVSQQLSQHSIAPHVEPLPASLVTTREIASAPLGSPRRAFLSMWSDLQWQSFMDATSYYPVPLIDYIGATNILQAFEFNAAFYRTNKPHLEGEMTNGAQVIVRYVLTGLNAQIVPTSITWIKVDGRWMVYYDPELDSALASWAQSETQQAIDPAATTPSPRAVAAGSRLAGAQGRYLASHG